MAYLATFGHEKKLVDISPIKGVAGQTYFIMVDGYYQGAITLIKGQWVAHLNRNAVLTGDDVSTIISMIQDREVT
jgi:hypothetical protein